MNYQYPHQFLSLHRNDVMNSQLCGCFHCLETFPPEKIVDWVMKTKTVLDKLFYVYFVALIK